MNLRHTSLCLSLIICVAGCGSDSSGDASAARMTAMAGGQLKPVVPVSGKVTVDGTAAGGVTIAIHAAGGGPELRRTVTKPDGSYTWTTYTADDGLEPGSYAVTFRQMLRERRNDDFEPKDDKLAGKFVNPQKSKFKLDVAAGAPQTNVDYELTTK